MEQKTLIIIVIMNLLLITVISQKRVARPAITRKQFVTHIFKSSLNLVAIEKLITGLGGVFLNLTQVSHFSDRELISCFSSQLLQMNIISFWRIE